MGLIDANELYEKRFTVLDNIETVPVYRSVIKAYDVKNAPVVEAIPIWWLDMFMQRYKIQGNDEYKLLHFMVTEWKKWEKENEKQTVG